MFSKTLLLAILLCAVALTGCAPTIRSIREATVANLPEPTQQNVDLVSIEKDRLVPANVTIVVGQTISFKNLDSTAHQIVSNPHPAHTDLPDFYSPLLYKNESYSYTFASPGNWGYHLEDNPSLGGKIEVR